MEATAANEGKPPNGQNGADALPVNANVMNGRSFCNDVDDDDVDSPNYIHEYSTANNGFGSGPVKNGNHIDDNGGISYERNSRTLMEELEEAEHRSSESAEEKTNGLSICAPPTDAVVFTNSDTAKQNVSVKDSSSKANASVTINVSNPCKEEDNGQNMSHQEDSSETRKTIDVDSTNVTSDEKKPFIDSQSATIPNDESRNVSATEEASNGGEWRDREGPYGSAAGSLPLHGTVIREGDMVSFIADNLEEKIRQSFSPQKYSAQEPSKPTVQPKFTPDESAIPKIDPTIISDLEKQATRVADNLDLMLGNLKGTLHNMSAISVGYMQTHRDSVDRMGETVDSCVKSMYSLIAKCEELNKNMQPVYHLSTQIKEIKRRLDQLEAQFK
ncbi:dentin sialophosphoprotein-like isoform X1 [Ptychodera flava]|uniref:dentin sialophosphoprotein-like isoform X1 n=1 Tax=Ptychodera flava TaxID=63121 RepID=UPI003969BC86